MLVLPQKRDQPKVSLFFFFLFVLLTVKSVLRILSFFHLHNRFLRAGKVECVLFRHHAFRLTLTKKTKDHRNPLNDMARSLHWFRLSNCIGFSIHISGLFLSIQPCADDILVTFTCTAQSARAVTIALGGVHMQLKWRLQHSLWLLGEQTDEKSSFTCFYYLLIELSRSELHAPDIGQNSLIAFICSNFPWKQKQNVCFEHWICYSTCCSSPLQTM